MKTRIKTTYLLNGMAVAFIYLMLPYYLSSTTDLTGSEIGKIMAIGSVMSIFAAIFWSYIVDITGKSHFIFRMSAILTPLIVILFLVPTENAFLYYLIIMAIMNFFKGPVDPINDNLAATYSQKKNIPFSKFRVFGALGYATSSFIVIIIGILLGMSGIAIFLAVIAIILMIATSKYPTDIGQNQKPKNIFKDTYLLFKDKYFLFIIFNSFVFFALVASGMSYQGILINSLGGMGIGVAIAIFIAILPEIILMPQGEKLIDRIGYHRSLIIIYVITILKYIIFIFIGNANVVIILSVLHGFALAIYIPWAVKYIKKFIKTDITTTVFAFYGIFLNLGLIVFNFLAGWILEIANIETTFIFYTTVLIGALIIILFFSPREKISE